MSIVREKLVKEDIELGHGTVSITDPTDPTGAKLTGNKVGLHTLTPRVYNVMDFGATGDGSTDDTTAIQLAITTAGADSVILFPVGDYLISDPLTITNSNVALRGLGTRWASGNGALIQSNDASSDVLQITGVDNVLVENLALRHKVAASAGSSVIDVQGGSQIVIQDCTIVSASGTTNCRDAINLQATVAKAISNCRVSGCYIGKTANEGVWVRGYNASYKASNVVIDNCLIDACTSRGIFIADYCTNINIEGNRVSNCAGSIGMGASQDNITDHICIRNNSLENATSLCHIGGERIENVLVEGNRIHTTAAGAFGIHCLTYCEFWSIIGNHIISCAGGGIHWDCLRAVIANNYIDWGSGDGIVLGANSYFSNIFGNVVKTSGTEYTDDGSGHTFGFNHTTTALVHRCASSYVGDGYLANGDLTFYLDESGNTLTFKVKYSGGAVKTGTVALT